MLLKIAPIDAALLSLVQLIQPASQTEIFEEAQGTIVLKILSKEEVTLHLRRLEKDRFLLRATNDRFIVAPKSYDLLVRSLPAKERDKARLFFLNEQRYKNFGLGA
jgi:hypothetical protein